MIKEERPDCSSATLAFLVHGIVLFPNIDKFMDHLFLEVVVANNLMPLLLAEFYHTFHTRHEKKGGTFLCFDPLLNLWMRVHMPQSGSFYYRNLSWPQKFASLLDSSILWYKREWEAKDIIVKYGGFLNVPLIGTHGCINYNPMLLKRQFGYTMLSPPEDQDLIPFIINTVDPLDLTVKRVRKDWTNIIRIDQEWGKKNILAKEPYFIWVKERARVVDIPLLYDSSSFPLVPKPEPILQEDMHNFIDKIRDLDLENTQLRVQLNHAKEHNHTLEDKGKQVCEKFVVNKNRLREVEGQRILVGGVLQGANFELDGRNDKLDQAYRTIRERKGPPKLLV
ncbi:uncharacterized protein LOC127122635 [Lathyrus oleraceus]|uniref:uncharacterized protein LOC127122635 n=1 Tax=Pisum sativum TaxID=3888 RepID=UPI0021D0055E|nr:uncharacterized protein LOC127122635 [Pisum sativum]